MEYQQILSIIEKLPPNEKNLLINEMISINCELKRELKLQPFKISII